MKPTFVDLFCGVGGMSLGLEMAGLKGLFACDNNRLCVEAYKRNLPHIPATIMDVLEISTVEEKVDLIVACPPPQEFSRTNHQKGGIKNLLFLHTAKIIANSQIPYFLIEVSPALIETRNKDTRNNFLGIIKSAGYKLRVPMDVLNAFDYGIPQIRKKLFLIGCLEGFPLPHYPIPNGLSYNVKDAIADLPSQGKYEIEPKYTGDGSEFSIPLRTSFSIRNCNTTNHGSLSTIRFGNTIPGKREPISHRCRLAWEKPCPPLLAGNEQMRATALLPIHPVTPRAITVREAARLSGLPDNFTIHCTTIHGIRQVSNAVPPALAKAIAEQIIYAINET
jgi:DNA (cytosine-5)-methyltransferase 1